MDDLAVLTPSFRGDVKLFTYLHRSVLANTARSVVHHVIVPPSDAHLFREYEGPRCRLWTHRDMLPRHYLSIPNAAGLALNLRRPWPPVRGWIVQQIVKMAGTAAIGAKVVLVADSDAVLVRRTMPDEFVRDGRLWHYRAESAITADLSRHVLWHDVAPEAARRPGLRGGAAARLHQPDLCMGRRRGSRHAGAPR